MYRAEPEYFETVTNPIDLNTIQQKLKSRDYEDVEQFAGDIELLVSNAKMFYAVSFNCLYLFT